MILEYTEFTTILEAFLDERAKCMDLKPSDSEQYRRYENCKIMLDNAVNELLACIPIEARRGR